MANENKLPTAVRFTLADDVREEANQKVTIVGAYTGNQIVLSTQQPISGAASTPKTVKEAMPIIPLALLAVVEGAQGAFDVKLNILSHSGKAQAGGQLKLVLKDIVTANLIFRFPVFPVAELGEYKAILTFDDKQSYEHTFRISIKVLNS